MTAREPGAFRQSLFLLRQVLDRLAADVAAVAAHDPSAEPMLSVFPNLAANARGKLDEVETALGDADEETLRTLDSVTAQSGLNPLAQAYLGLNRAEVTAKKAAGTGGEVTETAEKVFEKLSELTEAAPPLSTILQLAGKILTIVGEIAKSEAGATAAEKQIEEKLEQLGGRIGTTLTGTPIPGGPGTTFTPTRPPIKDELEKLETKLDRLADVLGRWLAGFGFAVEPGTTVSPSPLSPIKTEIEFLERVLREIYAYLGLKLEGRSRFPGDTTPVPRNIQAELADIERKLDERLPPGGPPGPPGAARPAGPARSPGSAGPAWSAGPGRSRGGGRSRREHGRGVRRAPPPTAWQGPAAPCVPGEVRLWRAD